MNQQKVEEIRYVWHMLACPVRVNPNMGRTPPVVERIGLKRGRRATRHSQDTTTTKTDASHQHTESRSEGSAAGRWYPPMRIVSPFYTEEPASFSPTQGKRGPSPGIPESPTLPALEGHAPPLSQQSPPTPLIQPVWKHGGSFSLKSKPPASPRHANLEAPPYPLDQLSDQVQDAIDGYFPKDSRVTSFASHGSGGSSSGSIPRASLSMTPVSDDRPGSVSPLFESPGISTPVPLSPFPSSPPPEYRRTWIKPPTSASQFIVPSPARQSPHQVRVEITPKRHLSDKGKGSEILHIDTSPTASFVATKHSNKFVKIWSTSKNALHGTIKITSYVQPRVRSREYFIRSHAILSENATLIGITTHFGLTFEVYNFAKGGNGAKKVQVIEEAHRWATSQRDAFHNDYAGLAVYRPKFDRIDRFFLARHPGTKTPFREDPIMPSSSRKQIFPSSPSFPSLPTAPTPPFSSRLPVPVRVTPRDPTQPSSSPGT